MVSTVNLLRHVMDCGWQGMSGGVMGGWGVWYNKANMTSKHGQYCEPVATCHGLWVAGRERCGDGMLGYVWYNKAKTTCVYVYVCVCMYVCMNVCMYACMYV